MFFLGRPAQYYPSYPKHSTPSSYHRHTSSYYPDMSYDDILDDDTFPELDVMPHAHHYGLAREYAMHQAHEHAIHQPREHVYLGEVARAQQAREAEERFLRAHHAERAYLAEVARAHKVREAEHHLKIRQAERAYLTQIARAQQVREEAQLRLRAQQAGQARLAQARVLAEVFGAAPERHSLRVHQAPSLASPQCHCALSHNEAPYPPRRSRFPQAVADDRDLPSFDSILSSIFGAGPGSDESRTKMTQPMPSSKIPAPKPSTRACPAAKCPVQEKQSVPSAQPTQPNFTDFLQALQAAEKGMPAEASVFSPPRFEAKQSAPAHQPTRGPQPTQPNFTDFLQTLQTAAKGASKPDDGAPSGNILASLLGLVGEPSSRESSSPSSDRIPHSTKGKGKATPLDPIPESSTDADDHTAAQLAADAAFAARLQAEEDRITARNMAQGMRFPQPTPVAQTAPARPKPEVSKADSTLEQLLQARAAAESDPEVLLAINRLLQSVSPVTSRPTTPVASSSTSATASPSVHTSTAAPTLVKVASPSTTLDGIASTLASLTSGFALPALDFSRLVSPASSFTQLPFTPTNKPLHAYEAALGKLLDRLDAIDAAGDDAIRARRRELVQEVEAALQKLDDAVAEQRAALPLEDLSADEEKGYDVDVVIDTAINPAADVNSPDVEVAGQTDAAPLIELEAPVADIVIDAHDEASQPTMEIDPSSSSPVTIHPLAAHTFPPGLSPLAATDADTVSDVDVTDVSSESDLGSHPEETVNTFLLPASRAPSPSLKPNHADSDEEAVLVKADEQKGSDGEWSEVDA